MDTDLPPEDPAVAALLRRRSSASALWLPVEGTSMGAAIVSGGLVQVVPGSRPRRGEVWAFVQAGRVVVHRSIGGRPGAWRFQGDAGRSADPTVPDEVMIGRVTAQRRDPEAPLQTVRRRPLRAWWAALRRRVARIVAT